MGVKKTGTKFTLQFSQTDPLHLQVAELLNKQGHRGKAQYLVNAVLHYENCDELPKIKRPVRVDEKIIEAVVNRILRDRGERIVEKTVVPTLAPAAKIKKSQQPQPDEEINFDEAMEELGEAGFNAIAGALDMFRKK